ncbi:hypothetical protein D3C78_1116520 [compost metagenome]
MLELLHDALQFVLLFLQLLFVAGNGLLQLAEGGDRVLDLGKGWNRIHRFAVVLDGHVHGQLMGSAQRLPGIAQLALGAMGGIVALDAQEVDLVNQRLADAIDEHRILDQFVEAGLRQPWQQLFLVDGLGEFFSEATQPRQGTARIDEKHCLG